GSISAIPAPTASGSMVRHAAHPTVEPCRRASCCQMPSLRGLPGELSAPAPEGGTRGSTYSMVGDATRASDGDQERRLCLPFPRMRRNGAAHASAASSMRFCTAESRESAELAGTTTVARQELPILCLYILRARRQCSGHEHARHHRKHGGC